MCCCPKEVNNPFEIVGRVGISSIAGVKGVE